MTDYKVHWEIDADTLGSPETAARFAWDAMRDPDSTANVFTVASDDGTWRVDLTAGTTELLWERGMHQHMAAEEVVDGRPR